MVNLISIKYKWLLSVDLAFCERYTCGSLEFDVYSYRRALTQVFLPVGTIYLYREWLSWCVVKYCYYSACARFQIYVVSVDATS